MSIDICVLRSKVELESGALLASLNMTATPGAPYAPTSIGEARGYTGIYRVLFCRSTVTLKRLLGWVLDFPLVLP